MAVPLNNQQLSLQQLQEVDYHFWYLVIQYDSLAALIRQITALTGYSHVVDYMVEHFLRRANISVSTEELDILSSFIFKQITGAEFSIWARQNSTLVAECYSDDNDKLQDALQDVNYLPYKDRFCPYVAYIQHLLKDTIWESKLKFVYQYQPNNFDELIVYAIYHGLMLNQSNIEEWPLTWIHTTYKQYSLEYIDNGVLDSKWKSLPDEQLELYDEYRQDIFNPVKSSMDKPIDILALQYILRKYI